MTRSKPSHQRASKPISHFRRNLLALVVAGAGVGFVGLQFDPTPAGGSFEDNVNLDKVTEEISVPGGDRDGDEKAGKNSLEGRTALLMSAMLLERGIAGFESVPDYTATFFRRERVDGELRDPEVMQVKVRHKPFGVYMKWHAGDKGREVLYVDGMHDDEMLVRLGGVKKIIGTLKLDPAGERAMKESRYPVTDAGLLNLAKKVLEYRRSELKSKTPLKCRMFDDQTISDRDCYCFVIDYPNKTVSQDYRKSVIFIDKEWLVPICVQNFGWPGESTTAAGADLDKETVVEDYRFSNIRLEQKLADAEFDRNNERYKLQ